MPTVETVGRPGFQPLPISMTMEPFGVSILASGSAKLASQSQKASPERLPYFFLRRSGNGGEVKTSWTRPRHGSSAAEARTSSALPTSMLPRGVR